MKIEDLKRNEYYLIVDNPRHPINPNGMVLQYIGTTAHPNFPSLGEVIVTYDFKIILIPDLPDDSWRFSIGGSYRIYKDELAYLIEL